MLQSHLHHASHEDREAPFGNAVLLGGPTGRMPQAALRVPAQGSETASPRLASGHDEQHDVPGGGGGPGRCYGSSCCGRGHGHRRHNAPHDAHNFSGGRPGLQLRYPTAPHHLRRRRTEPNRRERKENTNPSGVPFRSEKEEVVMGMRAPFWWIPLRQRSYVFFVLVLRFFWGPLPPIRKHPGPEMCKLIYKLCNVFFWFPGKSWMMIDGRREPELFSNATSAIGFALRSIWILIDYDLQKERERDRRSRFCFHKSRLHLITIYYISLVI